jgi:hypothetical protein
MSWPTPGDTVTYHGSLTAYHGPGWHVDSIDNGPRLTLSRWTTVPAGSSCRPELDVLRGVSLSNITPDNGGN